MSDEIIESLAAARPAQFHPYSAIDPATRHRELTAAFSAPARSSRHRRPRRGRRPNRLPLTVVAALSAALSIALIAAGVYLLHSSSPEPRPPKPITSKHPVKKPVPPPVHNLLTAPVAKPPPVTRAQAGMPPYYVVADHNGPAIEVRSTTTGELLSSVTLPAGVDPKLCEIAKGSDGRFVLALFALPRTSFYLLKVSDRGLSAQLSKLPVRSLRSGRYVQAVALSPDGAKLAFALQIPNKQGSSETGAIEVVTLATGSTRTWTSPNVGYPLQLSWTDHGRDLGFYWQDDSSGSEPATGLWKLDPTAPSRDLFSAHHVLPEMVGLDEVQSATFSPDGKTIDVSVYPIIFHKIRRGAVVGGIVKLSAETGRPLSTLLLEHATHASKYGNRSPSDGECDLIAADAPASHLLLNCATQFGRLDRGRLTLMPNPDPGVSLAIAW